MSGGHERARWSTEVAGRTAAQVVVAGGGIAGTFAALAAARAGASTLLIEQHGFLGGQGTAGGVHTFCGETRLVNDAWREMVARLERLSGIAPYRPNHDGRRFHNELLKYVLQELTDAAGVQVLLHTRLLGAERRGDQLGSLIVHNKSGVQRIDCELAIDATGDADLVALTGSAFDKGGPVFLPGDVPELDRDSPPLQLPMSLYFALVETDETDLPEPDPAWPRWERDEDLPMLTLHREGRLVIAKMKVIDHDATDGLSLSRAEQAARRQMMGLIAYLQRRGYQGERYQRHRLAWVAPHIGVREGRRLRGRYRMTLDDIMLGRHHHDAVAVGSYHTDYHWPTVAQRAGTGLTTQCPPYQIPLRALRPVGLDNVLVPGRCLSGEQIAMSSYRVMGTCAQTGFAAGTVAGLAAVGNESIDALAPERIRAALRRGGVRLDLAPYRTYLRVRRSLGEDVVPHPPFASCHASSLARLPNDDVVCVWFGGSAEGDPDVEIWCAIRHQEVWSEPAVVASHPGEPTWNPVLFLPDSRRLFAEGAATEGDDPPPLYLSYRVGDSPRCWRTCLTRSLDGGRTWDEPIEQPAGALGPIKNKPIVSSEGLFLAGSSVESDEGWHCTVETSDDGFLWRPGARIHTGAEAVDLIQPAIWESRPGHVHILMRSRRAGLIYRADSSDGGRSWGRAYPTTLPNNNSGLDVAALTPAPGDLAGNDRSCPPLVLVYNPTMEGRTPLRLDVSYDNGRSWTPGLVLEDGPGEYSYPAIVATAAGVAVSYTDDRRGIRFFEGSLEQLESRDHVPTMPGGDHRHSGRQWLDLLRTPAEPPEEGGDGRDRQ